MNRYLYEIIRTMGSILFKFMGSALFMELKFVCDAECWTSSKF